MPGLSLGGMIIAVREENFLFANTIVFRDGDSSDSRNAENPIASVSITSQINQAISDIVIATNYTIDDVTLGITANVRKVPLDTSWLSVHSVYLSGTRLLKTTVPDLDTQNPKWRSLPSGLPRNYYLNGMTNLGFDIAPDTATVTAANGNIGLLVVKDVQALAVKTDVPAYLPTLYSWLPVVRAAWYCAEMDSGNPKAKPRADYLDMRYKDGVGALKAFMDTRLSTDLASAVSLGGFGDRMGDGKN